MSTRMTSEIKVWSVFPLCGKTHLSKLIHAADSDSSNYSWRVVNGVKERNPEFPDNYLSHIRQAINTYDIVFVSTHSEVRNALANAGIPYGLVFPDINCKEEWLRRYDNREYNGFPKHILELNWESWISEMNADTCAKCKCILKPGEYISDVLMKLLPHTRYI